MLVLVVLVLGLVAWGAGNQGRGEAKALEQAAILHSDVATTLKSPTGTSPIVVVRSCAKPPPHKQDNYS